MTRIKALFRLAKWKWTKSRIAVVGNEEGEITDFDHRPIVIWLEDQHSKDIESPKE